MNRAALKTELQAAGFGNSTAEVARQNNWLDAAYLWVWNARDPQGVPVNWGFKRVDQATLAVVSGQASPTMPADFGDADWIERDDGTPLQELDAELFDQAFAADTIAGRTGTPAYYKVVNRQVVLGPTPSGSASYRMTYTRRVSHFDMNGATVSGLFTTDTDTPLWPDHHMILVYHAALIGHTANSNPFGVSWQGLRDDSLQQMRADLEAEFPPGLQWGAGSLSRRGW